MHSEKLQLIIDKEYVKYANIHSLTDFFDVNKGFIDIRMVYNGTSCGLNDAIWVPSFWLPTPNTALRNIGPNNFSVDAEQGDMFLNFPLEYKLSIQSGIDLSHYAKE